MNFPAGIFAKTAKRTGFLGKGIDFLGNFSCFPGKKLSFLGSFFKIPGKRKSFLGRMNGLLGKISWFLGVKIPATGELSRLAVQAFSSIPNLNGSLLYILLMRQLIPQLSIHPGAGHRTGNYHGNHRKTCAQLCKQRPRAGARHCPA